ncbi:MAG: class I SAM-dependent methyltransferase [Lachnospiraceae bacterium]|nr:class I SAM-dependent methyltransferase [Lachnospiraceae bacterium]
MEAYTDFAQVYDELMDETPYEEWCDFLEKLLEKHGFSENDTSVISEKGETDDESAAGTASEGVAENLAQERNTILDLGCGTGTLTELFARRGYDMIGIDNAQEMLQIAIEKRERSGLSILYLLQDMREFELYGTVGAVISVCDSLNYLLKESDIIKTFRLVNNYLYPQGLFIFDFNTVYKYAQVVGDATIAENREDCSFIWENYYHEAEEINEYDLTVFVAGKRCEKGAGQPDNGEQAEPTWFRRFQEVHYQRGYRLEQMVDFLAQAGLTFVEAIDADTHGEVTEKSERIYVVARKGTETTANQKVER